MLETNALKQNNNPTEVTPKSSRGWKWKNIIRNIWRERRKYEGQGQWLKWFCEAWGLT